MSENESTTSPELFQKFLAVQEKDIALRSEELILSRQKDQHAFEFGREALSVKARDRQEQRELQRTFRHQRFTIVALVICVVTGIIVYALHQNKDAFATEIIKAVIYLSGGGGIGYGFARSQQPPRSSSDIKSRPE